MQIGILNGIYADSSPELRTSYPVNLVPVPKVSGISNGFLRPGDGIVSNGTGPGIDRGGINWNGDVYRVMGTKLVEVSSTGTVTILGDVGGPVTQLVTFDYSFDELAVVSGGRIYFWDGATLTQGNYPLVTIGPIIDFCFIDGRFMLTDGVRLFVTDIGDPFTIGAFAFEEPIADPDPITSLLRLRNEVYAINRYTMEVYDNLGNTLPFPFGVIQGAQIQKGCLGVHACCIYLDSIAFVGSGRNEAPGIHVGSAARTQKISTQEIDELLLNYSESQLALVQLEARNDRAHEHLYVHLPDRTLVYDAAASAALQTPVWFILTSTVVDFAQYRARNLVWAYDKWLVGDPQSSNIGFFVQDIGSHWGQQVRWEFGTTIAYNEGKGALFQQLELVALTGSVAIGKNPQISTSYSLDGKAYSQERYISVGTTGSNKRLAWFQQGHMRNFRIQRFRGDSDAHISYLRLEAKIEALAF
jgi:hypothetical protein